MDTYRTLEIVTDKELIEIIPSGPNNYQRTTMMGVDNQTNLSIKICFGQLKSKYNLPDPYIKDTGVVVCGVDLSAGASAIIDPWNAGGMNRPIAATSGKCTTKFIDNASGKEFDINFPDFPEAPDGKLYNACIWTIRPRTAFTLAGQQIEVLEAIPKLQLIEF